VFPLKTKVRVALLLSALLTVATAASANADISLTYTGQGGPGCAELNMSDPHASAMDFADYTFRLINPGIDVTGAPSGTSNSADIFEPSSAASYQPDGTLMAYGFFYQSTVNTDGTRHFPLSNTGYWGFKGNTVTMKLQNSVTDAYDASATIPICNPDSDGDQYVDAANPQYSGVQDNCPLVYNPGQADSDNNGVGDACQSAVVDTDHDGVRDSADNCPSVANADQADLDGDGQGDACDSDIDGDGVANSADAFPRDPSESQDSDGDGVGDHADACPDVANAGQADLDGDHIGDACDSDIDGDGVANSADAFPRDATESVDTDGDGVGNNADTDDDNDGVVDSEDSAPLDKNNARPSSGDQCRNNGWTQFIVNGVKFKNTGDCVSWVATGGKSAPAGH
jgi:hypothetical protein